MSEPQSEKPGYTQVSVYVKNEVLARMKDCCKTENAGMALIVMSNHGLWMFDQLGKKLSSLGAPSSIVCSSENSHSCECDKLSGDGGDHAITPDEYEYWRKELAERQGCGYVSKELADDFWKLLVNMSFVNKHKETITIKNVKTTYFAWKGIRDRDERIAREKENEAARKAKEDEAAAFRRNKSLLEELPFD